MKVKRLIPQPQVEPQYEEIDVEFPAYLQYVTGTMFVQLIDENSALVVIGQSNSAEIRLHSNWGGCASHYFNTPEYFPCTALEFFDAAAKAKDQFLKLYEPLNPVKTINP